MKTHGLLTLNKMKNKNKKIEIEVDLFGNMRYFKDGLLHRDDGPAVEYANGDKYWFKNGLFHREDGPAVEYADGAKLWYKNCVLHRKDGPALEFADGYKEWWINGTRKRINSKYLNKKNSNILGLIHPASRFYKKFKTKNNKMDMELYGN